MPTKAEVETYLATNRVQEAIQEAIQEGMPTDALRAIGEKLKAAELLPKPTNTATSTKPTPRTR